MLWADNCVSLTTNQTIYVPHIHSLSQFNSSNFNLCVVYFYKRIKNNYFDDKMTRSYLRKVHLHSKTSSFNPFMFFFSTIFQYVNWTFLKWWGIDRRRKRSLSCVTYLFAHHPHTNPANRYMAMMTMIF